MPDIEGGSSPTGNADTNRLSPSLGEPSPVKQGISRETCQQDSDHGEVAAKELAREIHWVEKTSMWVQIGLAIIGILALCIYFGQLREMQKATEATRQAAYAACVGAQVSRAALIETQREEVDAHSASKAAVYQALAATASERASLQIKTGQANVFVGDGIRVPFRLNNSGTSAAYNFKLAARTVFIPRDEIQTFTYPPKQTAVMNSSKIEVGYQVFSNDGDVSFSVMNADGSAFVPTLQDIQDYKSGRKDVLTFATMSYADIFGKHVEHWCLAIQTIPKGILASSGHRDCVKYNRSYVEPVFEKSLANSIVSGEIIPPINCPLPQ
jgi:hypothetical protein